MLRPDCVLRPLFGMEAGPPSAAEAAGGGRPSALRGFLWFSGFRVQGLGFRISDLGFRV